MRKRNSGSGRNEECVMFFSEGNVIVGMIVNFYMMSRFVVFYIFRCCIFFIMFSFLCILVV